MPTVEFYRNACRVDRLEQPTKEKVLKHALALKELKLTESGFLTNIFPGNLFSYLILMFVENWIMITLFRLTIILSFAYICYNMFEFYCPEYAATQPMAGYAVIVLSVLASKKILGVASLILEPSFQKIANQDIKPKKKVLHSRRKRG